jgi:hypothetical protein
MGNDQAFSLAVWLNDFHASREQHEEGDIAVAGFEENVADVDAANFAGGTKAIDLLGSKRGKSLTANIGGKGRYVGRQDFSP